MASADMHFRLRVTGSRIIAEVRSTPGGPVAFELVSVDNGSTWTRRTPAPVLPTVADVLGGEG